MNIKVLLVEDVPLIQKIHCAMLESIGCVVDIAANGAQSVNMAKNSDYDIIFMDIGLPDFNGIEATKN